MPKQTAYKIRPELVGVSPLATESPHPKSVGPDRTAEVYGIMVHTTGSGIVEQARKQKQKALEHAVEYYERPDSFWSHYVVGYDGMIINISDEREKAQHCGFDAEERAAYLGGTWINKLPATAFAAWSNRWRGVACPAHLFPGVSPNNVYVGIELLPLVGERPTDWGSRGPDAILYTKAQHDAVVQLSRDIANRWGFANKLGWWRSGRLVGHEDVNPLTRSDKGGGWDPGFLRVAPRFDWGYVRGQLEGRQLTLPISSVA